MLRNPTLKLNFSQEVSQAVSLLVISRKWSLKHWRHQTCSTYSCMPATHSLMTEYLFGSHKIYGLLKYLIGSHKNLTVCRQRIKRSVLSTNQKPVVYLNVCFNKPCVVICLNVQFTHSHYQSFVLGHENHEFPDSNVQLPLDNAVMLPKPDKSSTLSKL